MRKMNYMLTVAAAALLVACQSANPASRIAENPVMFRALSPEQQLMVQQGRICEGMSKAAVFLAWGPPTGSPITGQKDGRSFERWVYTRQQPVPVTGVGYDPWGPWRGYYGADNGVMYVPETTASVTFENDRVTQWEKRR